jgi:3-isopropylmalate/(R)-2-methylmalate dehydratase small subunit
VKGRVWCFGDDINTDLIVPGGRGSMPERERALAAFSANRPGWSAQVRAGDILVAGRNFGTGSARPAAQMLRALGIACVLAESLNGLFFRSAVNAGCAAFTAPGVAASFSEGDVARVSTADWTVHNETTGSSLALAPFPAQLLALMLGGGVIPDLERRGLIISRSGP